MVCNISSDKKYVVALLNALPKIIKDKNNIRPELESWGGWGKWRPKAA